MGKPLKIILIVVAAVVLLLIAALATAALLFDPNDYRDDIAEQVEKYTGRSFSIDGDLGLRIFPWLAVSAERMTLGNADGFGEEPFARAEHVSASIRLLPLLLRREIMVGTVRLDGLALSLAVDARGNNNWDDLIASAEEAAEEDAAAEDEPGDTGIAIGDLNIAGVSVRNAHVRYADAQAGAEYVVEDFNFSTGRIRFGEPVAFDLDARLRTGEPEVLVAVKLGGTAEADMENALYEVRSLALELTASGDDIPGGEQTVSLDGALRYGAGDGRLSLEDGRLRAAGVAADFALEGHDMAGDGARFEGTFNIPEFSPRAVAKRLAIELPEMQDERNVLRRASLESRFQGSLSRTEIPALRIVLDDTTIDGSAAITDFATQRIAFDLRADRFDADRYTPVTADAESARGDDAPGGDINEIRIPVELLELINGQGKIALGELKAQNLTFTDVVLTIDALKGQPKTQQLQARLYGGNIALSNRVVPGTEPRYSTQFQLGSVAAGALLHDFLGRDLADGIANMSVDLSSRGETVGDIRRALNGTVTVRLSDGAVKGFNIAQTLRNANARLTGGAQATDEPLQTDFASLVATARITNGVLQIDDLDGRNPLLRLLGGGQVDLVNETMDILARPSVVRDLTGQEGRGLEELAGLEIPIRVRGSWADPSVRVDLETVLRDQAAGRLREAVAPREDELREKLQREEQRLSEKLEERVGEGAGDALRSLFGRSSRDREPSKDEDPGEDDADGDAETPSGDD